MASQRTPVDATVETVHSHHAPTVAAIAVVVYGLATLLHELGHALTGSLVGGDPTLITSIDVRGEWSAVTREGMAAIAVSGSLVNWLLAVVGVRLLCASPSVGGARWFFAWLLAAVNGVMPAMYMATSPIIQFGDWDTLLSRYEPQLLLRVLTSAAGVMLAVFWMPRMARALAPWAAGAPEGVRLSIVRNVVMTAWLTGGGIAAVAALFSPHGLARALPIAIAASLGGTWPLLPIARSGVSRALGWTEAARPIGKSTLWIVTGVLVAAVYVLGFGPGFRL